MRERQSLELELLHLREQPAGLRSTGSGATREFLGGQIWTFVSPSRRNRVAVFVSKAAIGHAEPEVLLFVHGHLFGPCETPSVLPEGLISGSPFQLGRMVHNSGRPIVLIAPLFGADSRSQPRKVTLPGGTVVSKRPSGWNAQGFGSPAIINGVVAETLLEVARKTGQNVRAPKSLTIAGHSRAYDVLYPLARAFAAPQTQEALSQGALGKLAAVWALDATYGKVPMSGFKAIVAARPAVEVVIAYLRGSKLTDKFEGKASSRPLQLLPVTDVSHCGLPVTVLPKLLAGLSGKLTAVLARENSQWETVSNWAREMELTPDQLVEFGRFPRGAFENGTATYEDVRDLLIAKYSSIGRAIAHYDGIGGANFRGVRYQTHLPTMAPRLASASQLIDRNPAFQAALAGATWRIGGFNIRRNRNRAARLSNHSFGQAVDFDAAMNPNLASRFPGRSIVAVTGEGVCLGEAALAITAGGTAETLLPWIKRIAAASRGFQLALRDEASLEATFRAYLYGDGSVTRKPFDDLGVPILPLVRAAAPRSATAARRALRDQLKAKWRNLALLNERRFTELREELSASGMKHQSVLAKVAMRKRAEAKDEKDARRVSLRSSSDAPGSPVAVWFDRTLQREFDWTIDTLIRLWTIFEASFVGRNIAANRREPAQTEGTPETIAVHGFFNLQPELVAALAGTDGGNLIWRGIVEGKDFMHFDLR